MQKNYDGPQTYKAKFEQSQLNATFGRTTKSTGDGRFKKPGCMRWDYAVPEKKLFVSSGDVLWLFEPEDKQAFRQNLKQSPQGTSELGRYMPDGPLLKRVGPCVSWRSAGQHAGNIAGAGERQVAEHC